MGLGDEAFLAGLVHNIGQMVEMQYDRNKLVEVLQRVAPDAGSPPREDMLTVEEEVFGANHQHFGAGLCEKWKFPANFVAVTGFHHRPLELDAERRTLTSMVYLADRLVAGIDGGYRLDLMSLEIDPDVLSELSVSAEKLAKIREQLPERLNSVADILG
jgi:HD-like signal output (HDOD) protein